MRWIIYATAYLAFSVSRLAASDLAFEAMLNTLLRHNVPEIRTDELRRSGAYVLLDARSKREYDVSHMPNAVWIGYEDFSAERLRGIGKDAAIVVYCSVGYRSEKIAERLIRDGYSKSKNYYGGIFAWVNSGGSVVNTKGRTTEDIHGYSKTWGIWLKRGKIIYN